MSFGSPHYTQYSHRCSLQNRQSRSLLSIHLCSFHYSHYSWCSFHYSHYSWCSLCSLGRYPYSCHYSLGRYPYSCQCSLGKCRYSCHCNLHRCRYSCPYNRLCMCLHNRRKN